MARVAEGRRSSAVARRRIAGEEGQALIEYALILGLIALVTIGVLQLLGQGISGLLGGVSSSLSSVSNP
jgi:pilus assembly protein Flp/PilA